MSQYYSESDLTFPERNKASLDPKPLSVFSIVIMCHVTSVMVYGRFIVVNKIELNVIFTDFSLLKRAYGLFIEVC